MELLIYQIAIPITLLITYLVSQKSNQITFIVAGIWGMWTLINVPYPPLNYFQFANILISYFLITKIFTNFQNKNEEIENERSQKIEVETRLKTLENEYDLKFKSINQQKEIKFIEDHETHVNTLNDALSKSKHRIIILSGWVTDRVIDNTFKNLLLDALKRGVDIYIGYGYQSKIDKKISRAEQKNAEQTLKNLQSWCSKFEPEGRLNIYNFPNHQKLLISDEKYMVCGSFNWLSNSGYSNNIELSIGVNHQETIREKAEKVIEYLNNLPPTRRSFLKRIIPFSDY